MNTSDYLQKTRFPTDFDIVKINLFTSTNNIVNLKPYLVELNIYEDVYNSSVSGDLLISDAVGLINNYSIGGTEFIELEFRKSAEDNLPFTKIFRLYKISKRTPDLINLYENYILHFCSEELFISEGHRICKSYKNTKISTIIQDIMNNYVLKNGSKQCYIEDTVGLYDFVIPNKKYFESINWLANYAMPSTRAVGADMLFFENSDGYWFKSLQSLMKQPSFQTYYYNPKNISTEMQQKITNIMSFEVMESFDTLNAVSGGTFSNRVVALDPLTRTKKVVDFNYNDYFKKSSKLNGSAIINNYKDRTDGTLYAPAPANLESGSLKVVIGNSMQRKQEYIKQMPRGVMNDIFVETSLPNRIAQLSLINYVRAKITVPGSPQLTAGLTLDLNVLGIEPTVNNTIRDPDGYYSGKYLVTAVRHMIQNNSYITIVELTKDSFSSDLSGVSNENAGWITAKAGK